jgi:sec-independent protein translocase protein TatC
LFAVPMCLLYFVGVFAGLALVMRREGRSVPWRKVLLIGIGVLLVVAAIVFVMLHYHVRLVPRWPYFTR